MKWRLKFELWLWASFLLPMCLKISCVLHSRVWPCRTLHVVS